ncbi:uncharacterized protein NPIL_320381 [Nephila pilipes]|uniref:Uncharacterized protein n=1 Tax=Nephila pilipes TaxID=299642 RepID=A0A8X6U0F6_NEPPI|nr:uncharacterized protein NPIL_320381 [Nephila pilipes]
MNAISWSPGLQSVHVQPSMHCGGRYHLTNGHNNHRCHTHGSHSLIPCAYKSNISILNGVETIERQTTRLQTTHITHKLVKRAIFIQWFIVMAIVLLPLAGFGLYYKVDDETGAYICARYRHATAPADVAYAYLMFGE